MGRRKELRIVPCTKYVFFIVVTCRLNTEKLHFILVETCCFSKEKLENSDKMHVEYLNLKTLELSEKC